MLTKIGPNAVRSTIGFTVSLVGRSKIVYTEGDKTLTVSAEMLVGNIDFVIYTKLIKSWAAPFSSESIDADEKERIIKNICDAFDFMGITYELD